VPDIGGKDDEGFLKIGLAIFNGKNLGVVYTNITKVF
jgi:hypothetical protein